MKKQEEVLGQIYIIKNNINDKVYIGQTIQDYKRRWHGHKHESKSIDRPLYRAMRKYGYDNFWVELIEDNIPVDQVTGMIATGVLHKWCNVYNTGAYDDTLVPIDDVTVRIFTLYNRNYSEAEGKLVQIDPHQSNNIFIE